MAIRAIGTVVMLIIIYTAASLFLTGLIESKIEEVDEAIKFQTAEITKIEKDTTELNNKKARYEEFTRNLEAISTQITERYRNKNAIPNLLNKIMNVIPETVQITSIQNTEIKHITITAQAEKYEQIAYFVGRLKVESILLNVSSDSGVKQEGIVKVKIEGDLP